MDYRPFIFLLCLAGPFNGPALAADSTDTVYIDDMLRVGVRPEPDSRSTPVGVVTTGMQLAVLDSRGDYLRIRTDKGLTGWIKAVYAAEEPPAMLKLEQLEKQRARTLEELEGLRQNVTVLQEANNSLNSQLDQVKAEHSKLQLRLARDTFTQKQGGGSYWILWLIGLVVAAVAAFAGGVLWQRRQTTRRLGGLRL